MGSESVRVHVLVVPYPVQGHINPMLQFSKRLASKGLKVTLITTTSITNTIQVHQSSSVKIACISDGSDKSDESESHDAAIDRFKAMVSQTLPQFIEKQNNSDSPAKVLVYDSVLPWILDIAHRFGLRGASFFTQACAVCAIYYHLHEGHFKIPLEEEEEEESSSGTTTPTSRRSCVVSLPSMPVLEMGDLPSFISDVRTYPFLLRLLVNQFSNFQKADWLLFNTFDKLEEEIVNWMASQWPIKTIGPTIPSKYLDKRLEDDKDYGISLFKPSVEACMKWLDTKEKASVVYVSFGSLAGLSEVQMEELAWGLKNSNSYFLWVVRASEQNKLPSNFMDHETLERGLIVNWCPQLEVLAHRAVGCFMTHCGWNSTLEALSLGVPMVTVPQWTDQATNAKCIVDVWHTGVRVKVDDKGIITREEIGLRIKEFMEGERGDELRRNAVRWKEMAKEAVDEGGSSDTNIEEFVSTLVHLI